MGPVRQFNQPGDAALHSTRAVRQNPQEPRRRIMYEAVRRQLRRQALRRILGATGGLAATIGLGSIRSAEAQPVLFTASGSGVNVKQMPTPEDEATTPLRESFSFDPHYAQCIVEDNPV